MATSPLTAVFTAFIRGGDAGDKDVRVTWDIASPSEETLVVTLEENAATTIAVPQIQGGEGGDGDAAATIAIIIPPTTNTQALRLVDGTGSRIGRNIPTILPLDGLTSLVLHLALGEGDQIVKIIFI